MARYPEVVIAGAGIGGLTAALALHEHGVNSLVLERAAPLRALGLGINLLPHAVAELDRLGLAQELSRIAAAPSAICYYRPDGTLLFREPRGIEGGYGWPQYSVHRGELQMLLLGAVRARLATIRNKKGRPPGFEGGPRRGRAPTDRRREDRQEAAARAAQDGELTFCGDQI
jgi:5-methylphenazine-1-carboxylate 1-monooxygenase